MGSSHHKRAYEPGRRFKSAALVTGVNLLVILLFLGLIEGIIATFLRTPPNFTPILRVLSSYYTDHDRRIIQAMPECAMYDPELTYVLRPGVCSFNNRDFRTSVAINSLGVRDDEISLSLPAIIALGDSFTMGWGVAHGETYPKLVEHACGVRTLNAGISSYGTVREIKLLERIDRSALKVLLIQYADNDFDENRLFEERGNQLIVMDEERYKSIKKEHMEDLKYYPGKHVIRFVPFFADRVGQRILRNNDKHAASSPTERNLSTQTAAGHFLNALLASPVDLDPDLRIIVFDINGRDKNSGEFTAAVSDMVSSRPFSNPIRSLEVLDLSSGLTRDKFFTLDDHISAAGHFYVADRIIDRLGCTK